MRELPERLLLDQWAGRASLRLPERFRGVELRALFGGARAGGGDQGRAGQPALCLDPDSAAGVAFYRYI